MDVTHVPSFGSMQYVHVAVDTYSHLIFASANTEDKLWDVKSQSPGFCLHESSKNCKN